ncbi:hypothetical protein BGX26_002396, partial [Mortierella sp. AD094]
LARNERDPTRALELSRNAKSMIKVAEKNFVIKKARDPVLRECIANAYREHGKLLDELGHHDKAQKSHSKAETWGNSHVVSQLTGPSQPAPNEDAERIPQNHFERDVTPPAAKHDLPKAGECISSTPQLAYCLALISPSLDSKESKEGLSKSERDWIQAKVNEPNEQERLQALATHLIRAFIRDELKKLDVVVEVVSLTAILQQDDFRQLLQAFVDGINQSVLLQVPLLDGLAQLIRNAAQGYMETDDLVKILELLNARLKNTHNQSIQHTYLIAQTTSQVLDSMVDSQVKGLSREQLHEPLSDYLKALQKSSDPFLVYQAAYAYQALLYVPDDESILQSMMRRTGKVVQGISGVVGAVKALDLNEFINGLESIQNGLAGAGEVIGLVGDAYKDAKALAESGQGLLESLKEGLSSSRKSSWYPALRGLDMLIQKGRFAEFEKLVQDAPCRHEPAFLWGVCQRLKEIASNPVWDPKISKSAISFMADLYNDDPRRGCQTYIKRWILILLDQLAQSPQGAAVNDARKLLHELQAKGNTDQAVLHEGTEKDQARLYSVISTPPSQASPLLNRIQNKVDVETTLHNLKRDRLKDRGDDVYISPRAKADLRATEAFDLTSKVREFLESNRTVFLILGDSGAGKSTFNRALEISLWDKYEIDGRIPLFINLPTIEKPERDLIAKRLRQANFRESQIMELKLYRKFILICDGYDEIRTTQNLYTSNQLNQPGEWRVQMLISCRTENNGADYKSCFQPTEQNDGGHIKLFQEASIMPFSKDQILDYIGQYVFWRKPTWESGDYQQALNRIPNLLDLVENPFLLRLALEVLPRLFSTNSKFSTAHITRVHLYDEFVTQWIERGKTRLRKMELNSRDKDSFRRMTDSGFKQHGTTYLKDLVVAIYDNQSGHLIVSYSELRDRRTWKESFFSDVDGRHLLREAIPLTRDGNRYRFIHRSVLEYGLALAVYDPDNQNEESEPTSAASRRGTISSALSADQSSTESSVTVDETALLNSPLGKKNLVGEQSVIQFLAERVKHQPIFKDQLHSIIERSKTDKSVRIAAANAITILARAGVQFNCADLRNIQIPGADLSFGVFDSAQLEGADLEGANLRNIWMRQANLRGAQMTGVHFGELPFLQEDRSVWCCAYSPDADGKTLAVGLEYGNIVLYETTNWKRMRTLSGHSKVVGSLSFSVAGDHIISGSDDKTVRLWNVDTSDCTRTLLGHTDAVKSVAYSPKGTLIASGSYDKTIRLWDHNTGECIFTLQENEDIVWSVAFSPKGDRIASASNDATVRLWDVDASVWVRTLKGHLGSVASVVYSPKGDRIASGSEDKTVRLWNVDTGDCVRTLQGHTGGINSALYSPKGDQVISGSSDKTVRLWDVDTGECLSTFKGHTSKIYCVVYSPKGDWIASGSWDQTVRLWDVRNCEYNCTSQGHIGNIRSVTFSPKGDRIVSGSDDNTIRLWDVDTGDCVRTLQCPTGEAKSVAYSPNGNQIASGSENGTVQLWDVEPDECLSNFQNHRDKVPSVAYSPKGDWIASGSDDKTVQLWDAETGELLKTLLGHTDGVNSVSISPKGDRIASGGYDTTVRLWDVDTEKCLYTLLGHSKRIWSITFSPNGCRIASGSSDETVRLWDADTGDCIHTLLGHTHRVHSIVFSPKGDQIASGSYDRTVRLWGVDEGQCLSTISALGGSVYSIAWSKTYNDQYLITGGEDKAIRRWRLVKEGHGYQAILCWRSPHELLTLDGVIFDEVKGLSPQNKDLLVQRSTSDSNTSYPK